MTLNRVIILPEEAYRLAKLFHDIGTELRVIGGYIRDSLLGLPAVDIDFAVNLLPEKVVELLQLHGIKVIDQSIDYGTVIAYFEGKCFEITTLRCDVETYGRAAKVEFVNDFRADAARRDFTINAMSYSPINGKLYDYFGGIDDLEMGIVRFIGDAEARIQEDYLRILRFFRFSARYAKEIDIDGLAASIKHAHSLQTLSKERTKAELDKIISTDTAAYWLALMAEKNILQYCLADIINIKLLDKLTDSAVLLNLPITLMLKYAGLFTLYVPADLVLKLKTARFSNREAALIEHLVCAINDIAQSGGLNIIRRLWFAHPELLSQYVIIYLATGKDSLNAAQEIYRSLDREPPVFPLKASDLIELNIIPRYLGKMLAKLKESWIDSNFTLTSKNLLQNAIEYKKEFSTSDSSAAS